MDNFANTVFSGFLGWLRTVAESVWSLFNNEPGGGNSFLIWAGKHWMGIVIALCAAGLAADFAVYFFRWQPYRVWKSFFTRNRNQLTNEPNHHEVYRDEPEYRQIPRNMNPDTAYSDLDKWEEEKDELTYLQENGERTNAGYYVPADSPYRRPESSFMEDERDLPERMRIDQPRRRRTRLFRDPEETAYHYDPPKPFIDERTAYHAPVYPKRWNNSGEKKT